MDKFYFKNSLFVATLSLVILADNKAYSYDRNFLSLCF